MKVATRKKVVRALRKRIENVLGETLPTSPRDARRTVSSVLQGRAEPRRGFLAGVVLGLWSEVEDKLKERPEPTAEELKRFLQEIEHTEADFVIRPLLRDMLRKLPPFPPGKEPSLNPQQQREALAAVRRLTDKPRITRKAAYEKVAKRYGVHWRTIQNLWTKNIRRERLEGDQQ